MKYGNVFTREEVVRVNEIMKGEAKAESYRAARFMAVKLTREEINKAYAEVRRLRAANT